MHSDCVMMSNFREEQRVFVLGVYSWSLRMMRALTVWVHGDMGRATVLPGTLHTAWG